MALTFNGTSDYIEATGGLAEPITIAAWFQKVSLATTTAVVSVDTSGAVARDTLVSSSASGGIITAASTNAAGTSASSLAGNITANTWVHGTAVFTNATARLAYTNGATGAADNTNIVVTNDHLHIGARYNTTRGAFHDGIIAEVGVWTVALTAAEVASLGKGFCPRLIRPQSLYFYAPLMRTIQDLKGGLTLTTSGTAVANHPRILY